MDQSPAITSFPWVDFAIVAALIVLNGIFAMAEIAIVSARRPRLLAMARRGVDGARIALSLGANPGKFLSTIQIGITVIAVGVGAFSGASLAGPVASRLSALGMGVHLASTIGFVLVVSLLTLVSLIFGELVPKQYALRNPEPIAAFMAKPMAVMSTILAPIVWCLDGISAGIFQIFGLARERHHHVTAEELHHIFAEAHKSGVIEESERAIISGIVRLADRPVREVMTPRTEVVWIDVDADTETLRLRLTESGYSRILVAKETIDDVMGLLLSQDVMIALLANQPLNVRALMREATIVPDQLDAMDALVALRTAEVPLALVHDEYGHFEGIVTPADLLDAIAGVHVAESQHGEVAAITELNGGALEVAGWTPADVLADRLAINLPDDRDYATVAGFVLAMLRRLPEVGDHFIDQGYYFEVRVIEDRRIEQMFVRRI